MNNIYKNTTYNINIAEYLDDEVRIAWEEGHPYSCIEVYSEDKPDGQDESDLTKTKRVGFIMFEMGIVKKMAILVHEYVEMDYRDRQIGTKILEDSCKKLFSLGYKGIYASIKGHEEEIEGKRYFLDSQGFLPVTRIQIPMYFRDNIVNSEWYRSCSDIDSLRGLIVDVNKESKDNKIIRRLAKEGITLSENVFIKTITQSEKTYGAILYGFNGDDLFIYDVHVFERKNAAKLANALLLGVFMELDQMDEKIRFVKICANNSSEYNLLLNNLGEPYDLEIREEWLLRLRE